MTQSVRQQHLEDATSERVMFNCDGCGRETIIHVGINSMLLEKRCSRCAGSDRVRPHVAAPMKGQRTGTHGGRRIADADLRARRKAKSLRASRTRMAQPFRAPCGSYEECGGHKHRKGSYKTQAGQDGGRKR